jgi:hypothetical protein
MSLPPRPVPGPCADHPRVRCLAHRAARHGRRGTLLVELLIALALCGVLAAVAVPALAGTMALDDRTRAFTAGALAAASAVEMGVGYPCGIAPPPVPPAGPRLRLHLADHHDARASQRQATVWYTPPHGRPPRPLVVLASQVACP